MLGHSIGQHCGSEAYELDARTLVRLVANLKTILSHIDISIDFIFSLQHYARAFLILSN